jgi:hypothetical protein
MICLPLWAARQPGPFDETRADSSGNLVGSSEVTSTLAISSRSSHCSVARLRVDGSRVDYGFTHGLHSPWSGGMRFVSEVKPAAPFTSALCRGKSALDPWALVAMRKPSWALRTEAIRRIESRGVESAILFHDARCEASGEQHSRNHQQLLHESASANQPLNK